MSKESKESLLPKAEALVSHDLMKDDNSEETPEERYLDYNYNSDSYGYPSLSPYYQTGNNNAQLLRKQLLLKQQLARQQQLVLQQQRNQQQQLGMNTANSLRYPQSRQGLAYASNRYTSAELSCVDIRF